MTLKHMIHGPCGDLNQENVCMRDGRCKNYYPKEFVEYTLHGKEIYPVYRRIDDNRQAKVRGHMLNNQWVIPHYDADLEDIRHDERLKRNMLIEFFTTNFTDPEIKRLNLLYKEFLRFYVWDDMVRTWTPRKKEISIDGPRGIGKSFLYTVLNAHIRSKGYIGLIVLSLGLLHRNSLVDEQHIQGSKYQLMEDRELNETGIIRSSKIIIWDEAPMSNKLVIEALDKLL
ncbi:hypothetical protein LIER_40244 [Lithospermum erythrorhizon]|uniref:ATP-dependent DNA helicase n=1 Tax=Lithospermum erythrorhizon TaxID=34254 RepID=A0AAV3QSS9_LITER